MCLAELCCGTAFGGSSDGGENGCKERREGENSLGLQEGFGFGIGFWGQRKALLKGIESLSQC